MGPECDPKLSMTDIAMQEVSLKIETPNGLVSDAQGYEFVRGEQQRIRADILSDADSGGFRHVLFYAGNPDEGAVAFADRIAFGVKEGGPTVWANWTPRTVGQVTLYARVLERPDDPQLGNAQDSITLNVWRRQQYRRRRPLQRRRRRRTGVAVRMAAVLLQARRIDALLRRPWRCSASYSGCFCT
jgi:hypothetical protein